MGRPAAPLGVPSPPCWWPIGVASGGWAAPATAATKSPTVDQLVVFKSGKARQGDGPRAGHHGAGRRRRCALAPRHAARGAGALAPGSDRAARLRLVLAAARPSGGQLFVRSIRGDRNRGQDGWIYKVGRRLGTRGRRRPRGAVRPRTAAHGAARHLVLLPLTRGELPAHAGAEGHAARRRLVTVIVRGYDDNGRGVTVPGATVSGSGQRA